MKKTLTLLALGLVPSVALADPTVTVGGALNFGFDAEDKVEYAATTAELFADYENNGFRAGLWLGSLYKEVEDFEYELTIGYGRDIGDFYYDVGLIGYFLAKDGYQSTGLGLEFGYALTDQLTAALYSEVDLDSKDWIHELSLEYAIDDRWTLAGLVGRDVAAGVNYGEIGVGYAINDSVALELLYENGEDTTGFVTFTIAFETTVFGG